MKKVDYGFDGINETMLFDLRAIYAFLVGDHMRDVAASRQDNNYPEYFKGLDDLFTIIRHKILEKNNKPDKLTKVVADVDTTYSNLKKEIEALANAYPAVWLGNDKNQKIMAQIETKLKGMEKQLYYWMEYANMFGNRSHEYDPDEI